MTADPYWYPGGLDGFRREFVTGGVGELALEFGGGICPELAVEGDIFIGNSAAVGEGR